jgi:hypothetical protein
MRTILFFCFMISFYPFSQESGKTSLIFYKQKDSLIKKEFVIEENDFVKVKLKNGSSFKGRISNIHSEGFKLDSSPIRFIDIESLGMNTKERRKVGQILSSWILGIVVVTGATFYLPEDDGVMIGVLAITVISGITSIYTIDLAYGKRKKFDFSKEKWKLRITTYNDIYIF